VVATVALTMFAALLVAPVCYARGTEGGQRGYLALAVALFGVAAAGGLITLVLRTYADDDGYDNSAFWLAGLLMAAVLTMSGSTEPAYFAAFGQPAEARVTAVTACSGVACVDRVRLHDTRTDRDLGRTSCDTVRPPVGSRVDVLVDPRGWFPPRLSGCSGGGWYVWLWLPAVVLFLACAVMLAYRRPRRLP
jgi:hypothetical protein